MYPRTYYETFMRYEASHEVFVAMPFSIPFKNAFETAIKPAIENVKVGGKPLAARVINRGISGAPDIHEKIFDAIIHSRLVVADMTVQASSTGNDGVTRWQANANVAYEVGLASAWRNPEDIILIHQKHPQHAYSFDIQNLRHVSYNPDNANCAKKLAEEIVHALNQSMFLSQQAYKKILHSISPSAIQFMHQEARRAFPVISFKNTEMPLMDARIHAATDLLACGALKNRHVLPQGGAKGIAVIYEWTELGLQMLTSVQAVTSERQSELAEQIASVPAGTFPPSKLMNFPEPVPAMEETKIDMVEDTEVDSAGDATSG